MNEILIVGIMIIVGAIIGGFTNALAIKMLFRPHYPRYIKKWKVPFTPGLIPKRRSELADQLGKTVVKHLITKDAIAKKLNEKSFQQNLLKWVQAEARKLLMSERSLGELMDVFHLNKGVLQQVTNKKIEVVIRDIYDEKMVRLRNQSIDETLPSSIKEKIDGLLPSFSNMVAEKLITYFSSEEGKRKLGETIDEFLVGKGMLGNMVTMFLGNERVVDKVQPEVIKFFQNEGNRALIETILTNEWDKLKEQKVAVVEVIFSQDYIVHQLIKVVQEQVDIEKIGQKKIKDLIGKEFADVIVESGIPKLMKVMVAFFEEKIEYGLQSLNIEEIVKEQVESFSIRQLEEMVLDVSRRELKMITVLGAVLGGMIGLVQGVMLSFFS